MAAEDDSFAVIENADLIEVGWTIYIPSAEEAAAYLTGAVAPEVAEEQPSFEGQKVVVVTQTGYSIGGPIEDNAPEWEALTGGEVELQQFAFGEMFEKMITSFETGAVDYDMLVFPAEG
jgi:multiple sugar transport system substrate-binding protein